MPVLAVRALLLALAFLPSSTTADVIAYSYYTDAVCATSSLVQKYVEDSSSTCTPSSCADDSSSGLQRTIECPTTDVSSSISSLASTPGFSGFKSYTTTTVFGGTTSTCLTVEKAYVIKDDTCATKDGSTYYKKLSCSSSYTILNSYSDEACASSPAFVPTYYAECLPDTATSSICTAQTPTPTAAPGSGTTDDEDDACRRRRLAQKMHKQNHDDTGYLRQGLRFLGTDDYLGVTDDITGAVTTNDDTDDEDAECACRRRRNRRRRLAKELRENKMDAAHKQGIRSLSDDTDDDTSCASDCSDDDNADCSLAYNKTACYADCSGSVLRSVCADLEQNCPDTEPSGVCAEIDTGDDTGDSTDDDCSSSSGGGGSTGGSGGGAAAGVVVVVVLAIGAVAVVGLYATGMLGSMAYQLFSPARF